MRHMGKENFRPGLSRLGSHLLILPRTMDIFALCLHEPMRSAEENDAHGILLEERLPWYSIPLDKRDSALIFPETLNLDMLRHWATTKALLKSGGNVTHAAEFLGIQRTALAEYLRRYPDLRPAEEEDEDLPKLQVIK